MRVHFQAPSGKSLLRNCCSSMPIFPGTTRFGCCGAARTVYLSPRSNPCPNPGVSPRSRPRRSEEHTSELQSLMRISYAVFCLKKKNKTIQLRKRPPTTHQEEKHHKNDKTIKVNTHV